MLTQRIITAVALIIAFLLLTLFTSPFLFAILAGVIVLVAAMEWTHFIGPVSVGARISYVVSLLVFIIGASFLLGINPDSQELQSSRVVSLLVLGLVFWIVVVLLLKDYPGNRYLWSDQSHIALMGVFVLLPTWVGIVQLKYLDTSGMLLLALVAFVSVADIGAFFVGRSLGNAKLAPLVSPKKTWAGFWGGMASSLALASLIVVWVDSSVLSLSFLQLALLLFGCVLIFVSSVIGDLFESMLKRNQNLKDSGNILPGHGGILDRIDSLTAATPVALLILLSVLALA